MNYTTAALILLIANVYGSGTYNQNVYSPTSTTQTNSGQTSNPGSTTSNTPSSNQTSTSTSGTGTPHTNTSTGEQASSGGGTSTPNAVDLPSTTGQTLQPSAPGAKDLSTYMPYIIGGTLLALMVCIVLIVRILKRKRHDDFPGSM